jgi:hypothetical protein
MKKILLLIMSSSCFLSLGQNVEVFDQGGNSSSYLLSDVQKITFSSGEMILTKQNQSTSSYLVNKIKRLSFEHIITNQEDLVNNDSQVLLYPNPVSNELNIDITETCTVSVLNLKGEVLITKKYSEKGKKTILLGGLSSGLYLCQYVSNKKVKTIKIIKE